MLSTTAPLSAADTKTKAELRDRSYASPYLDVILPRRQIKDLIKPVKTILFLHIPKAGGTTLCLIADGFQRTNKLKMTRFAVPRIQGQSPNLIFKNWTGGLETALTAFKQNPKCCEDLHFISGHIPFGLHKKIEHSAYVVLIRKPFEREISSLNFDDQRGFVPEGTTEEYLFSGIDNPQTRMLAGIEYMTGEHADLLDRAKKNIEERCLLAGVTEDATIFMQILFSIQGWEPVAAARGQVTGKKIIETPSPEMKKKLEIKHSIDMELYEWVKDRWNTFKKQFEENSVALKINPEQEILCLQPKYAQTRKPEFWTLKKIEGYNKEIKPDADLVEILQTHVELRLLGQNQENALTPAFTAAVAIAPPLTQPEKSDSKDKAFKLS